MRDALSQADQYVDDDVQVPAWLLLFWLQDPTRKPAIVAFTEGPLRQIAYAVEAAISLGGNTNAQRYAALRATLGGYGAPPRTTTWAPVILDALSLPDTAAFTQYRAEGLDAVCDRLRHDVAGKRPVLGSARSGG